MAHTYTFLPTRVSCSKGTSTHKLKTCAVKFFFALFTYSEDLLLYLLHSLKPVSNKIFPAVLCLSCCRCRVVLCCLSGYVVGSVFCFAVLCYVVLCCVVWRGVMWCFFVVVLNFVMCHFPFDLVSYVSFCA